MTKKSLFLTVAILVCLVLTQGVFALDYPNDYKKFEVKGEKENFYSLEEAFWFNPTVYSLDVLEFAQAYLNPDDPVGFFLEAAEYTDEQIDDAAIIFQSFIEPDSVGAFPYLYRCDLEALAESIGADLFDADARYEFSFYFEDPSCMAELFPRGVGRTDAYNTFRRCALSLAIYAQKHGNAPGFEACYDYIQKALAYYEEQFNAAMEAEAQAAAENGAAYPEAPQD
ncbi:MAG: hypothetical protein J6W39_05990 [Spirochaetales bacterium]|nr:hypothetical protein [Spirochaetales bacterium]